MSEDYLLKVLRSHDDIWKIAIFRGEVVGAPVHPIQFPVHPVKIEVADTCVGEYLVHLKFDALLDQPLAHISLRLARAPHPIGGDRTSPISWLDIVACPCI